MIEIVINKEHWSTMPSEARELLILHELGHLVAGLEHTKTEQGQVPGIMSPTFIFSNPYPAGREVAIQEFKQQVKDNTPRHRTRVLASYSNGICDSMGKPTGSGDTQ
jgi:hypothetical protein